MQTRPIIVCPHWQKGALFVFNCPNADIEVTAPKALLNQIIKICDGHKTRDDVIAELGKRWDKRLLNELLRSLEQYGILCDAVSLGDHFWRFVNNPMIFARELDDKEILRLVEGANRRNTAGATGIKITVTSSPLNDLIENRRSTRTFSIDTVKMQIIAQMLWAGYGIVQDSHRVDETNPQRIKVWQGHKFSRHTVPSAGALYPMRLSLVLLRSTGRYKAGIYDILFRNNSEVELLPKSTNIGRVLRSFADHTVCNNAQGIIVISGSFRLSGQKYSNRSTLYVPIEVGHIAQNIHLSATENGMGTVEIGGFLEEAMKQSIGLPTGFWPLTTILFGHPAEEISRKQQNLINLDIQWAPSVIDSYELPFSMVFARPKGETSRDWSCGRASEPNIAFSKALSEACEWASCGIVHNNLVKTSFEELEHAIDPRKIVCYHEHQYKARSFPLIPFDERRDYLWVEGVDIASGEKVYILSDCVYFPYTPRTPRYTFANSSGTAAHPNRDEMIKHATMELVERDSFMIVWLNRLQMPSVATNSLPEFAKIRIKRLRDAGFRVTVKDLTLDLAPIVFVFVQNESLGATSCAACSSFDINYALDHALEEVEAAAYCRLRNQNVNSIRPRDVRRTHDHADLYGLRKFFRYANFLGEKSTVIRFSDVAKNAARTWKNLLDRFEDMEFPLLMVNLQKDNRFFTTSEFSVAKIFIPGIISMSFGYGMEPCGMERIYTLPVRLGYRKRPSRYGELTKFPHPYT